MGRYGDYDYDDGKNNSGGGLLDTVFNFGGGLIKGLFGGDDDDDEDAPLSKKLGKMGGSLIGGLLNSFADDEEDKDWVDYVDSFEDDPKAYYAYFQIKHERGEEDCELAVTILDKKGKEIETEIFDIPFDKETAGIHDRIWSIKDDAWLVDDDDDDDEDDDDEDDDEEDEIEESQSDNSIEAKLLKLKKMFEKGIIDEDEYKSMKKKYLEKL